MADLNKIFEERKDKINQRIEELQHLEDLYDDIEKLKIENIQLTMMEEDAQNYAASLKEKNKELEFCYQGQAHLINEAMRLLKQCKFAIKDGFLSKEVTKFLVETKKRYPIKKGKTLGTVFREEK